MSNTKQIILDCINTLIEDKMLFTAFDVSIFAQLLQCNKSHSQLKSYIDAIINDKLYNNQITFEYYKNKNKTFKIYKPLNCTKKYNSIFASNNINIINCDNKNRFVIPAKIIKKLGYKPNDKIQLLIQGSNEYPFATICTNDFKYDKNYIIKIYTVDKNYNIRFRLSKLFNDFDLNKDYKNIKILNYNYNWMIRIIPNYN